MHSDALECMSSVMKERKFTLSLAESCTGGMVSSIVTGIPGASEFFSGSVVVYSNISKEKVLGVRQRTLVSHGAVSRETAEEMAVCARKLFGSDIAASVTGIAGPSGGSAGKPVGTVFVAVTDGIRKETAEHHFSGSRDEVQRSSSWAVISMILDMIMTPCTKDGCDNV